MTAIFEPKAHVLLQMGEFIGVAEKYKGVRQLLFCVLFWVQRGRICLQVLKILEEVVGPLNGYHIRISV